MAKTYKVVAIGYGPAFNMGPLHIDSITSNEGFELAAVVDPQEARQEAAKEKYPDIETFADVDAMLAKVKPDLALIITPHNTHATIARKCLEAKCHVVVEKPMCVTTAEVKDLLAAAKANGVMLSTFHNRRWDADFCILREIVEAGTIGEVFRIEAGMNRYSPQNAKWWRSNKDISGGNIYDWGAHFTDWILTLHPERINQITGFQVKNQAWNEYSNEDHSEYTIKFADDCMATLTISNLSMVEKPRWMVRGTKGAVVAVEEGFSVRRWEDGKQWQTLVRYDSKKPDWHAYYRNVADHIRDGAPLVITGEGAGRVICVLDAACQSAAKGGEPVVPHLA